MQVSKNEPRTVRPQPLGGMDSWLTGTRALSNIWISERVVLPSEAPDSGERQGPGVMEITHKRTPGSA